MKKILTSILTLESHRIGVTFEAHTILWGVPFVEIVFRVIKYDHSAIVFNWHCGGMGSELMAQWSLRGQLSVKNPCYCLSPSLFCSAPHFSCVMGRSTVMRVAFCGGPPH